MRTSESISKITTALLAAQKAITFAEKSSTNPHFKSKYANLESVIYAIKGPLNDNGIVFMQTLSPSDPGYIAMTTRLIHISGEWIEDTNSVPLQKNDAQGYGSAASYCRRYGLSAITGLIASDDDGEEASKPKAKPAVAEVSKPQSVAKVAASTAQLSDEEIDIVIDTTDVIIQASGIDEAAKAFYDVESIEVATNIWANLGAHSKIRTAIKKWKDDNPKEYAAIIEEKTARQSRRDNQMAVAK